MLGKKRKKPQFNRSGVQKKGKTYILRSNFKSWRISKGKKEEKSIVRS